jgi:hypothetical protein
VSKVYNFSLGRPFSLRVLGAKKIAAPLRTARSVCEIWRHFSPKSDSVLNMSWSEASCTHILYGARASRGPGPWLHECTQDTQHSQETDIHAPGGIRTLNPASERPQCTQITHAAMMGPTGKDQRYTMIMYCCFPALQEQTLGIYEYYVCSVIKLCQIWLLNMYEHRSIQNFLHSQQSEILPRKRDFRE